MEMAEGTEDSEPTPPSTPAPSPAPAPEPEPFDPGPPNPELMITFERGLQVPQPPLRDIEQGESRR